MVIKMKMIEMMTRRNDDKEDDNIDNIVGEEIETQDDGKTTSQQQQNEQSVQDTQVPSGNPPHDIVKSTKTIVVKDVSDILAQNINPLIAEELKKILDKSTLQAKLYDNPILVIIDELQKAVTNVTRDKVNLQEPSPVIPLVTQV